MCSFYGNKFHGRITAAGEKYNRYAYTAAHRTLPFNTCVEVTNLVNQKTVVVRINDRGPHSKNRIIDVSRAAAEDLGMISYGVVKVSIRVTDLTPPPDKNPPEKPVSASRHTPEMGLEKDKTYNHDLSEVKPLGWGIHIGTYRILNQCMKMMVSMEKKFDVQGYVNVTISSGNVLYRLVLGDFDVKNTALQLREKLLKEAPACYVVEWQKIKDQ